MICVRTLGHSAWAGVMNFTHKGLEPGYMTDTLLRDAFNALRVTGGARARLVTLLLLGAYAVGAEYVGT